jgi:hypothetical protein
MNTIRDNIPVEQLLKQYIDETQEIDVEKTEKVVEEEMPKTPVQDTSSSEDVSAPNDENIIPNNITFKDTPDMDVPPPSLATENNSDEPDKTVAFANTSSDLNDEVNSFPMSNNAIENKKSISLNDDNDINVDLRDSNNLKFGDNVPLVLDDDFDKNHLNEIEEIHLDFDEINDESTDPIDLGIEELAI